MISSLVFTTSYPRTPNDSAGIFVARLFEALGKLDVGGTIIVPLDHKEPQLESKATWKILRYRYGIFSRGRLAFGQGILPNLRQNPALALQIPALIAGMFFSALPLRKNSQLVIANWLISAVASIPFSLLFRIPSIVIIRGEDAKLLKLPILGSLLKILLRQATAVIAVSEPFKKQLLTGAGLDPEKVFVIYNGISSAEIEKGNSLKLREEIGAANSGRLFLSVGRVIRLKRIEKALEIFAALQSREDILVICGPRNDIEYNAELTAKAKGLGIAEQVRFLGEASPEKTLQLIASADIMLATSEYEGRPNALLEGMAQGLLCIASDIPAHREVIVDGVSGIIFADDSPATLAARLAILDLHAVKRAAREVAKAYTWEAAAKNYLEVCKKAINTK